MIHVAGYTGLEIIHQNARTLVYSATRTSDGKRVDIRQLRPEVASPESVSQFREEYDMLLELGSDYLAKPLDFIEVDASPLLVTEGTACEPLAVLMREGRPSVSLAVNIGRGLAHALDDIHTRHVIHRDLSPGNIIYDTRTHQLQLTELGIATVLRPNASVAEMTGIDGALPYLAPEQTGRLNRSFDYRANFYSLGVTLYELLTGKRPFTARDDLALVHSHIAKDPTPPDELNIDIPRALSRIVMKLLAKTPEDRYQSAYAIDMDLAQCQHLLSVGLTDAGLMDFEVALDDVAEQIIINDRLIGREAPLKRLGDALDRVLAGGTEIVACIGAAGVGKTALIREFEKQALANGGVVATGLHNPIDTETPYSAVGAAFNDMVRNLLTRPDFASIQQRIVAALRGHEAMLLRIIPDLQLILNDVYATDAEPAPADPRRRLLDGLTALVGAVARPEMPLVFCLDNIQWLDHASIELFDPLLAERQLPYTMLVGAYRTQDLADDDPIRSVILQLARGNPGIDLLRLENLGKSDLEILLSETLFRPTEETSELAELIFLKTGGNPLATRDFLMASQEAGEISFDREHREWNWQLQALRARPPTEDVGDTLASQIGQLDPDTVHLLRIASCIGIQFDLETVQAVAGRSYNDSAATLARAIRDGYLLSGPASTRGPTHSPARAQNRSIYLFANERIQQAAYSLLDTVARREIHVRIGNAMLKASPVLPEVPVFELVNQLNHSIEAPDTSARDLGKLVELNRLAGRQATQTAAFQAAFKYHRTALALCGKDVWNEGNQGMQMHLDAAEAAYLCGDNGQVDGLVESALAHTKGNVETARLLEIKLRARTAANSLDEAMDIGHSILDILGVRVSRRARAWRLRLLASALLVALRLSLQRHPGRRMTDERLLLAMRVLISLCRVGYVSASPLTPMYVLRMTHLSLAHGAAPESSFAYPLFGSLLIGRLGLIDAGYGFGQMALDDLSDDNRDLHCRTITLVTTFINPWKHHLKETLEPLSRAQHLGEETDDVEYSLVAAIYRASNAFLLGHDLNSLEITLAALVEKAGARHQPAIVGVASIYRQAAQNLMQDTSSPWHLEGSALSEDELIQSKSKKVDELGITNLFALKMFIAVLFRRHRLGAEFAAEARKNLDSIISAPTMPFFIVYESLALIGCLDDTPLRRQITIRARLLKNRRQLRKWSYHSPQNILHGYHLIEAEMARHHRQTSRAISHYESAIKLARSSGYLKEHALATELAGRFYHETGRRDLSVFYLERARMSYRRWGAVNKIQWIDDEFAELRERDQLGRVAQDHTSSGFQGRSDYGFRTYGSFLDLDSVIKASQILSGEIILETLLQRLMQVSLENAGAHSASLILSEDGALVVEITTSLNGSTTEHRMETQLLETVEHLPVSVIQYVARTQEDLVLNDAPNEGIFTQDRYILAQQPKSIICIPILSKSHLTGLLYLENRSSTRAFTQDRIAILKLLASQSAIAIENAKLYQQLNESRDKYLSLYENAMEGIFEIDRQGEFSNINPAAAHLLGYTSPGMFWAGERPSITSVFADSKDFAIFQSELASSGRIAGFDTQITGKNGSPVWVSLSAQLIGEDEGIHLEGSIIDITERKLREKAEQARVKAEAATETKSQFLASMSHEIRTPMNAIIGYTELAQQTSLNAVQSEYLNTISASSNHLLRVVNDILDLSKVESGKLELQMEPFSLMQVLKELGSLFGLAATAKGLTLEMADVKDTLFVGDSVRIGQVLINLVGNALKFTNTGSIAVDVTDELAADGRIRLSFSVKDTGVGIEPAQLHRVFESFTQGSRTDRDSGTGLGLAICRRLVEMMDGQIEATSTPGIGSQFDFTVIVQPWQETPLLATTDIEQTRQFPNGEKILVVEDNQISRDLAREVLHRAGYEVTVAGDGAEAIAALRQDAYHVVLMDVRMPVMDGLEAIRTIRADPELRHQRVIALSAGVLETEIRAALDAGFDDYLGKPVDFAELLLRMGHTKGASGPRTQSNGQPQLEDQQYVFGVIDFARPLRNNDYDLELVSKLLTDFIDIYEHADDQLAAFCQNGEDARAERLMHNVAGVAGNFGADQLMTTARSIEQLISNGTRIHPGKCKEFTHRLRDFISAIESFNRKYSNAVD